MNTPASVGDDLMTSDRWTLGGYSPGSYMCICLSCKRAHEADKRATQCVDCAARDAASQLAALTAENARLIASNAEFERKECMGWVETLNNEHDQRAEQFRRRALASEAQLKAAREALQQAFDFLGGIDGAVEVWAAVAAALIDARVNPSLIEQAFREGLAYGSNVENADPDLAWKQSRLNPEHQEVDGDKPS